MEEDKCPLTRHVTDATKEERHEEIEAVARVVSNIEVARCQLWRK
jgi:hypothetical protein